ncbi:hypothetical protein Tco_1371610 [Tanacetum coccineum]
MILGVLHDETPPPSKTSPLVDDDLDEIEAIKITEKKNLENDIEDETLEIDEIVNIKESLNHLLENVDYVRVGNQSIERDRLIEIGLVMDLVKFLSFTFGGKEMTFVVLVFLR